jgi:hypothetical protein
MSARRHDIAFAAAVFFGSCREFADANRSTREILTRPNGCGLQCVYLTVRQLVFKGLVAARPKAAVVGTSLKIASVLTNKHPPHMLF